MVYLELVDVIANAIIELNKINNSREILFEVAMFYGEEVLKHEEFIHCATLDTYEWVINVFYNGETELVIAVFDSEKITSEIKYETARRHPGLFPHVYGLMNMDALKYTKNFFWSPFPQLFHPLLPFVYKPTM